MPWESGVPGQNTFCTIGAKRIANAQNLLQLAQMDDVFMQEPEVETDTKQALTRAGRGNGGGGVRGSGN